MASSTNLAMGFFESRDRGLFQVRAGGSDCLFLRLKATGDDEVQDRVSAVASLQDLDTGTTGTQTAIPDPSLYDTKADDVHKRITSIAPNIAEDLGFKDNVKADVPFRLICRDDRLRELPTTNRLPAFIALSYCWHDPTWVLDRHSASFPTAAANFSWPISRYMVKALLLERTSWDEGIWIDQCCINQDDPQEKSGTIGFMNLIYKQARVVVVVLEDVMVNEAEAAVLENLMHECSSQGPTELSVREGSSAAHHVVRLALKIFSARWFTRAWCNHEFLVHVCTGYDYFGARDIHHPALVAQIQRLSQRGFLHILFDPFGLGQGYNIGLTNEQTSTSRRMKSPLETFRNVSKFGAKLAADKIAITLNIVGSGLYYKGPERPEQDYGLLVSVLSLASGDPAVLCCSGVRYKLPGHAHNLSWIQRPASLDFAGIAGRNGTHHPLDYVPSFSLKQVQLDLFYVGSDTDTSFRRASSPFLKQAQWYIDGCIGLSNFDPVFRLGDTLAHGRATKIQLLACALECGARWIDEAASAKTSADYPDPDLERAIQIFFPSHDTDHSVREIAQQYRYEYEILIDFVETLTLNYVSPIDIPFWSPVWISTGPGATGKIVSMCPAEAQQFTAMIPALLLDKEYTNCKRMFWLEEIPEKPGHWKIIGKSSIFGAGLDVLTPQDSRLRKHQVIEA
ncbi:MAG: hypothetical protein LQ338_004734 [Usnochroma carphineum]|nr:MAG: hypothetical protein LQ338_004734 [Usnochroma carphineum]